MANGLTTTARIATAAALSISATLALSGPAQAATAPTGCRAIKQLGPTAYVKIRTITVASVKQYYGTCNGSARNWSYVWVWSSFRAKWDTTTSASIWDNRVGGVVGVRSSARNVQEFVSYPTATTRVCTSAVTAIKVYVKGTNSLLITIGGGTKPVC